MAYTKIEGYRIPYHLDGTSVRYNTTSFAAFADKILTSTEVIRLNSLVTASTAENARYFVVFFTELINFTHMVASGRTSVAAPILSLLAGSPDTTDGVDGTWITPTITGTILKANPASSDWWLTPATVTFSQPVKTIRFKLAGNQDSYSTFFDNLHLYGTKATGQTPNDIVFLQSDGVTPYTTIQWDGALYENQEKQTTVYIKNTSAANTANNLALSTGLTNKADISFSVDNGATFVSSYTLTSLAPGATQKIIIKNKIGAAPQVLGPRNGSIDCVIGSWT